MEFKVINSEDQYDFLLAELERLVAIDPALGSVDSDRLQLLAVLVEDYERRRFKLDPARDPVGAIEFRMAEQGLRQIDLVPYFGSRSRVSEVLSRKRPLTITMIRALSSGLGIPVNALVSDPLASVAVESEESNNLEWKKFPFREMEKRGYFEPFEGKGFSSSQEMIEAFLSAAQEPQALFRRSIRGNGSSSSRYAILAWTARILTLAKSKRPTTKFDLSKLDQNWFKELVSLSWFSTGPLLAVEYLNKFGLIVIVEPHLPTTLIDGAALLTPDGTPIIALTLRYDRLDNFWFTLLHELAHIARHISSSDEMFVDRVDKSESEDAVEKEADRIARDILIPRSVWRRSAAFLSPSKNAIQQLANELRIHPAIVVGRLHRETGNYTQFRDLIGQDCVRALFNTEGGGNHEN